MNEKMFGVGQKGKTRAQTLKETNTGKNAEIVHQDLHDESYFNYQS